MFKRPLRALRSSAASRRLPHLLAGLALASCSAPFTSGSTCGNEGRDCAISSGSVSQAGEAAAGEAPDTTSHGGAVGNGGVDSNPGAAGLAGAESSSAGQPATQALPTSCAQARKLDPSLGDGKVEIDPDGAGPVQAFDAQCDMTSDGGGWTKIGVGEYWQKNDLHLTADAVLPWAELSALLRVSEHLFRAGDGEQRLYLKDEGALVERLNDPAGTNSAQPFLWRSTAPSMQCAKNYAAIGVNGMLTVTSKEISCEPLGFGKHTCGMAAGWILFHRNDTTNWSGQNPCAFPVAVAVGGTALAPTAGGLSPLWLR